MPTKENWYYNYEVLARLTDQPANTIQQHVTRRRRKDKHYDLGDLEIAFAYLCEFARPELKFRALCHLAGVEERRAKPAKRRRRGKASPAARSNRRG